ncbi:hypothetical protein [Pseudopontixanthobacter vadosimaris]|uniref:hypothetical protein n=1 Tax=Pseudopontixanthobacter vadosimaris TaxID=2726450 RepID=UPI001F0E4BD0|nr:hypothetical protein [Pseudopontixanthobacter vadosimaris]
MKRIVWIMPVAATLGLGLTLSGCKDEPAPAINGGQGAEGQVAGGTISDAMLPLATVRSGNTQSAPVTGGDGGAADAVRNGAEAGDTAADESGASEETDAAEAAGEDPAAEQEAN